MRMLFSFPNPVNETSARLVAGAVTVLAIVAVAFQIGPLLPLLAYGFLARALTGPLRSLQVHLLLEPGRSLIGPGGALVTRVLYRKQNNDKKFVVVDAAMNDLLRPSLYDAFHEIVPVRQERGSRSEKVDVVGPICETGDFFAHDREMPVVAEGDLVAILDAGAYGMALASNYNSRPRAAEILVKGRAVQLIRRREKFSDLTAAEGIR